MKQLTIRGIDEVLERTIRDLSEREGISLSKAVLRLLMGRLRESSEDRRRIGDRFDRYFGTWSEEEADAMLRAVSDLRHLEEDFWL